ncbi:MAG: bifunctional demethylmenaquinone methyltransferase/2-methoxy-6-polyprenyl-1,4-benzoquinol methylase UbiE [Bryobacteraceae bacterium]
MSQSAIKGTTPEGVQGEKQVASFIRGMFDDVAPRYDLLNTILSFNIDRYWRWRTVRLLAPILDDPRARTVDLCCGSGALTIALRRRAAGLVLGSDFSHRMLEEARKRISARQLRAPVFEADALRLPMADESVNLVTAAFGFRNFANYRKGLEELRRVLKPGGTLAILEFSTPPNALFRAAYQFYSTRLLPRIAALFSPRPDAYSYLPESVRRFPNADEFAREMRDAGFGEVRFVRMTFGIVALHLARRMPHLGD